MKLIYISGPIRGKTKEEEAQNRKRAEDAILPLAKKGWSVICPHTMNANLDNALTAMDWIARDLIQLDRCDAICMMANWEDSMGAQMEYRRAVELKMPIYIGVEEVPSA